MPDELQTKLDALISVVPKTGMTQRNNKTGAEYYGEVPSATKNTFSRPPASDQKGRDKWLEDVKKPFTENPKFHDLTGLTHTELLKNWVDGGIKTSCNGFVGTIAGKLGLPGMGSFGLQKLLEAKGKGHCWVTPASGEKPQYGDLFETNSRTPGNDFDNLHVGISLYVDGEDWWTIEGGQGGPFLGYDRVARVKKKYNTEHLLGWVDMRMLLAGTPAIPSWVPGTWTVHGPKQQYIYYFNRTGGVAQKAYRPQHGKEAATPSLDTGSIISTLGDTVKVRWNCEGGIETFTYDRSGTMPFVFARMSGKAADGTDLSAVQGWLD
ncbi:hypothetical protein F183_A30390 [Bryobacterales bacterium F-183]|nr:hypothetical protein F183_A30390 [Bryobacterales bacterium F-183]